MSKRKTISISSELYTKLEKRGYFRESFDDVIQRLLKQIDYEKE